MLSQAPATNAAGMNSSRLGTLPLELLVNVLYQMPNEDIWQLRGLSRKFKSAGYKAMALKLLEEVATSKPKSLQTGWDKADYARKIQIACVMRSVANDSRFAEVYCELSNIADAHLEKRDLSQKELLIALIHFASIDKLNEAKDFLGTTILHIAAAFGHADLVKPLLRAGAKVDTKNRCGKTALHVALSWKCYAVAILLIEKGTSLDTPNMIGVTPREIIMSADNPMLQALVERTEKTSSPITHSFEAMRLDVADQAGGLSEDNQRALSRGPRPN